MLWEQDFIDFRPTIEKMRDGIKGIALSRLLCNSLIPMMTILENASCSY